MKKFNLWMMAAILSVCGTTTTLTSCSGEVDNPVVNPIDANAIVGEWILMEDVDGFAPGAYEHYSDLPAEIDQFALIYHFYDDGKGWKELNVLNKGEVVMQLMDRFNDLFTYQVDATGKVLIKFIDSDGNLTGEANELKFDGNVITDYVDNNKDVTVRATDEQIKKFSEAADAFHGGADEAEQYDVNNYKPVDVDNSSWMKQLPDDRLVADLSLPGSHDACTAEGWFSELLGGIAEGTAKTQDLTIDEQLKVGMRVFDLRPEHNLENGVYVLRCSHGIMFTKLLVIDFFRKLKQFLAANPTEFCVLTVDLSATTDKKAWGKAFAELIGSDEFSGLFADFKPRLTVGDMRGHVLILSKFEYAQQPTGGYCYGWVFDAELEKQQKGHITGAGGVQAPLWVQDYWGNNPEDPKVGAVIAMLEAAAGRDMKADAPAWVINYPSAYFGIISFSDSYRENAVKTNKATVDWLADHTGSVGIIYMDFAGMDYSPNGTGKILHATQGMKLTDSVIKQNFK